MVALDPIDTRLLDEFQRGFPLETRPFARIGLDLGMEEGAVLDRLTRLSAGGAVARVGATVRPNTAGASTLAALAVPEGQLEEVAALVGAEPGVNHSYQREADWNLWFVATAADERALAQSLERIRKTTGLRLMDLRLERAFNIDLGFRLSGEPRAMGVTAEARPEVLRPDDRPLLHALSQGFALVPAPYAALADGLGRTEEQVLSRIGRLVSAGIITRLGVIVRHRPLGWTANAMVVWDLPEARIDAAGLALATHAGVTLCYRRRRVPGVWPYALYCMIHGQSREATLAVLESARQLSALQGAAHRVLFSTRCFKQSGARLAEAA